MNPLIPQDTEEEQRLRTLVLACYLLGAIGLMSASFPTLVALIVCYIKRSEAQGTVYESHFDWMISTFWVAIVGTLVSGATVWLFGLGWLLYVLCSLWVLYRFVKGGLRWFEKRAVV